MNDTATKAQSTPGPWIIKRQPGNWAFIFPHNSDQHVATVNGWDKNCDGNANVIAAAPDLLAALEYVRQFYQDNFSNMPIAFQTVDNVVADAIAKAKGE